MPCAYTMCIRICLTNSSSERKKSLAHFLNSSLQENFLTLAKMLMIFFWTLNAHLMPAQFVPKIT
jgi:hypothetical protein